MSLDTESSKRGQQGEAEAERSTLGWAAEAVKCCMDMFISTHSTVYVSFSYSSRQSHDDNQTFMERSRSETGL